MENSRLFARLVVLLIAGMMVVGAGALSPIAGQQPGDASHDAFATPVVPGTRDPVPEITAGPTEPAPVLSPLGVEPGTGAITGCTQRQESDVLGPGSVLAVECSYITFGGFAPTYTISAPRSSVSGAATGWSVRLTTGQFTTGWVSTTTTLQTSSPAPTSIIIELRAPTENGVPNETVLSEIGVVACNRGTNCREGNTTISARMAGADASQLELACSPQPSLIVPRASSATVTCSLTLSESASVATADVRTITISLDGAGWDVVPNVAAEMDGGRVTISPAVSLSPGESWIFELELRPTCTASDLLTLLMTTRVGLASTDVEGPSTTYAVAAVDPVASLSTSMTSADTSFFFTASFDEQQQHGNIRYRVSAGDCAAWSVTIAAGPFTYSGDVPDAALSATHLSLTSIGEPVALEGSASELATGTVTGSLETERIVLSGPVASATGVYEQDLGIMLTLPPATVVGTYESTITITAAAAP